MTENLRRESDARTLGELVSTVATLVGQVASVSDRIERLSEVMETRYQRRDLAEAVTANLIGRATDLAEQIRDEKHDRERADAEQQKARQAEQQARERAIGELWERREEDQANQQALRRWLIAAVIIPLLAVLISAASAISVILIA